MTGRKKHIILCNGAQLPKKKKKNPDNDVFELSYNPNNPNSNVQIHLPDFVKHINHLPNRIKDLLEIAAYVFAGDRNVLRGTIKDVVFENWDRIFHYHIKVREPEFWNQRKVKGALSEALTFISGDRSYEFTFLPGVNSAPTNLFDTEEFKIEADRNTGIILFSGGLDSLTGIFDRLKNTDEQLCLVSHRSGQPSTIRTQKKLLEHINLKYPGRCLHYLFRCSLKGETATEETQRTRSFLYSSIAFALSYAYSQSGFYFYENGITSINFSKRQDLINARASRTTHPKTITLLEKFFSIMKESPIKIHHPYLFKTKSDVVALLAQLGERDVINSSVSCSKTFQRVSQASHCGGCSQCIDRRFAMYSTGLEDYDGEAIYSFNFLKEGIIDGKIKTTLIDYVRLAKEFDSMNSDNFFYEKAEELSALIDSIPGNTEEEKVEMVYNLCKRHGEQINTAIKRMQEKHDNPYKSLTENSFLHLVGGREHLKEPVLRLVETICKRLAVTIPLAFQKNRPKDENDFNDKLNALIENDRPKYEREHPLKFGLAKVVPDHLFDGTDLLIESKYLRGKTSPSTATEGIAADLTKLPQQKYKLFVVYDPDGKIADKDKFVSAFESKGNCKILIIK